MKIPKEILIRVGLFLGGFGVGTVVGTIFSAKRHDKKYEALYVEEVKRQVGLYKAHLSQPTSEHRKNNDQNEKKEEQPGRSKSSLDNYSARKVDEYTKYSRVYADTPDNPLDDDDYHNDGNYIDGKVDSEKLNKIEKGGTIIPQDIFDSAPVEDRVELFYYTGDGVLADEDNDVLDQDELFGDALAEFRSNPDIDDICIISKMQPGRYFCVTKVIMAFSEVNKHG